MYGDIIGIAAVIAVIYHATCVLLNRRELKRLNDLIASETPATLEKKHENRVKRRASRLTDRSRKWLDSKGNGTKEVG